MANKVNIKLNNTNFYDVDTLRLPTVEGDVAEFSLGGSPEPPTPGDYDFYCYTPILDNDFYSAPTTFKMSKTTIEDIGLIDSTAAQAISEYDYKNIYMLEHVLGYSESGSTSPMYFKMNDNFYEIDTLNTYFIVKGKYVGEDYTGSWEDAIWYPSYNTDEETGEPILYPLELINYGSNNQQINGAYALRPVIEDDPTTTIFPISIGGSGIYDVILIEMNDGSLATLLIKLTSIESELGDYHEVIPPPDYVFVGIWCDWNNSSSQYGLVLDTNTGMYVLSNAALYSNYEVILGRGVIGGSWDTVFGYNNTTFTNFPNDNDYSAYIDIEQSSQDADKNIWFTRGFVANVYYDANNQTATIEYVSDYNQ